MVRNSDGRGLSAAVNPIPSDIWAARVAARRLYTGHKSPPVEKWKRHKRKCNHDHRLLSHIIQGLLPHGPGGAAPRREHVSVLLEKSARQPGEGAGLGGCGSAEPAVRGESLWTAPDPCALHAERVLGQAGNATVRPRHHDGRHGAPARHTGQPVQFSSGQPHGSGHGGWHRADCGGTEADFARGGEVEYHGAAGNHGGQGQRDRWAIRGAGGDHRPRAGQRQSGRVSGYLSHPRRGL